MKLMGLLKNQTKKKTQQVNRIALQGGTYSIAISVIVLAILIAVNVMVSAMPTSATKYDISSSKLYSITSNTKVVVNALEKDVTIYWIVQSEEEDAVIENLLGKYESLSDHIKVVKKNPDVYPTFAEQYTSEEVPNNSLIVACGDKNRYISYNDIYLTEANMTTYSYDTSFDGEGAITSAIDYVINEEQRQLYLLEGHGESELPDTLRSQIEKENIETATVSLLNIDEIPEEADCVMIYAPTSDISTKEKEILDAYVENGGKLMVVAGPTEDGMLGNLYSMLENYGVESEEGIIVENDRESYAFDAPYILLPQLEENEVTTPLIEKNYYAIFPIAQGMKVTGDGTSSSVVTELLTTSDTSYNKVAGYSLDTYEKEEKDTDGPFVVSLSIDCNTNDGQIVWFSSSVFLEETYNSYSSGANLELTMNAMSSMIGENEAVAIRSKSLDYNYLTISDSTASLLKIWMIGIFPIAYLGIGIGIVWKRRRRNEAG